MKKLMIVSAIAALSAFGVMASENQPIGGG